MKLDEPYYPEESDEALEWAVDREFELRSKRYELLRNGGLGGALRRTTEALQKFQRVFVGIES